MSDGKVKVTVVVLTFNTLKSGYLEGCFDTLAATNTDGIELEVMAVDNCSSDGTPDEIRRRWPGCRVIDSGGNWGYAGGNNLGIQQALDGGSDYVYLINHDTEVDPDFLVEAVRVAQADETVGCVQSLLLLHPDRELVNSTGNAIHFLGFGYCLDYRRPRTDIDTEAVREVAYASGAGALYRADVLRLVGGFDPTFFMYHEDLDLGWRIRLAGYRNVMAPKSVVWHKYEFSRSIGKFYYMERNRYLTLFKNLRLRNLLVLAPFLVVAEVGLALPAVRGGWWLKKLKSLFYFLNPKVWRHVIAEREKVASWRRVSDREIAALFTPVIRDQEQPSLFAMWVANPLLEVTWKVLRPLIR
ncbi:MAG: glycosyltransferase family 2 protein [bacterium]